jgi:UDP-3-O-[3-hydroxymyristoyl] glucosamine N-acyltransferase
MISISASSKLWARKNKVYLSTIVSALGIAFPSNCTDMEVGKLVSPEKADINDIIFLSDPKYRTAVESCKARFVIAKIGSTFTNKITLEVSDPYVGYARVAQLFEDTSPLFGKGISPSAIVDPSAIIDASAAVGPGTVIGAQVKIDYGTRIAARCVIEKGCTIGKNCRIDSGAVIRYDSIIGNRVIIQSGAIIGSDGFGNARENNVFIRIPAFGNVIIEDDADIGANTTIDRGNFEPTVIGKGVKLDNLIQIAHNVTIGENSALAAQAGISGSTSLGKRVIVGGQAGFVGHIEIGDDAFVGAKSGISKSVEPGGKITGYPARDFMTMRRIEAAQQSLPALLKEVKLLKSQVESLQKSIH